MLGLHLLLQKQAKQSPVLKDLLHAKKLSDQSNFTGKNTILAKLLRDKPGSYFVDSELNAKYVGVTHKPTGFRIHAPRKLIPVGIEHRITDENKNS